MTAILHMHPRDLPQTWEDFCASKAPYSIALDGYVATGPRFDQSGPWLNLNHHEEVDRLATRATCAQVLMALRQGLSDCFRDEQGFHAEVYANDCDEDVCLSWFLLAHGYLAEHVINPALNRLVAMEDALDATAGAYPYPPDLPTLRELAWVFEPYYRFRATGGLDRREADAFAGVVTDVEHRIMQHVTGRGGSVALDTRYRRAGGGPGWVLMEPVGAQARTGLFADGVRAYLSFRQRPDGNWTYTLGRMSLFIPFDVPAILAALNEAEGCEEDHWGGGNTVAGSPRVGGSRLPPQEVERIVNEVLADNGQAN
jgi:hypothetical protein